jgi:hypothetical protein
VVGGLRRQLQQLRQLHSPTPPAHLQAGDDAPLPWLDVGAQLLDVLGAVRLQAVQQPDVLHRVDEVGHQRGAALVAKVHGVPVAAAGGAAGS